MPLKNESGFTIIELLIASLVFAVVLLLVTFGMLQITKTYYKGLTAARTQQTARSIIDQISQQVQLSGSSVIGTPTSRPPAGTNQVFCIGDDRYSYQLGRQLVDGTPDASLGDQVRHVLVVDTYLGCSKTTPQDLSPASVSGRELLSPRMRLSNLVVEQLGTSSLYHIKVTVTSGEKDLMTGYDTDNPVCIGRAGSQFCAVSTLETTVQKRLN